ncbi:MAG: COG4315 family predicted lipoprotein [Neoaquamicrobium sediminum]|uniref:COG4315 family predicted lipoprotein n=1 Tax=Neoaquamicrobium sediminum TaxID=1849104 RepID=UPI0040364B69
MKIVASALTALFLGVAAAHAAEPAQVKTVGSEQVYTDSHGMTLYTFDKDAAGKSNCDGDCAAKWPPFQANASAKAEGDWTLVKRSDGAMMWAFKGKPLYTYAGDKKAGEMSGDGVGGNWHAAKAG